MSISLNEWMAAKELLVLLAQALSGKSDGIGAPLGFNGTALIAQRVFSKPFGFSSERFPHAVRLLPTLQIAKKQIERWIETLPAESSRPDKNLLPTGKQHPQNGNLLDAKQGMQGSLAKTLAQGAESERLASKAHKLVEEVRIAIQTLSTSSFLGNPRPAPLRAALAKLKPLVDEFIEAISKNSLDPQQNGSFSPFKHQPRFRTEHKEGNISRAPLSLIGQRALFDFNDASAHQIQHMNVPSKASLLLNKNTRNDPLEGSKKIDSAPNRAQPLEEFPANEKKRGDVSIEARFLTKKETSDLKKKAEEPLIPNFQIQVARDLETDFDRRRDASRAASLSQPEEQKGRAPQERPPLPIFLAGPVPGQSQIPLEAAKKKKRRRYFFKGEKEANPDRFTEH